MGDISQHFNRSEFACQGRDCCGHSAPVDPYLLQALEQLRNNIAEQYPNRSNAIHISSGFRCNKHNAEVKGSATDSLHTKGMAADIFCLALKQSELIEMVQTVPLFRGIGAYPNRTYVHVDVRSGPLTIWTA